MLSKNSDQENYRSVKPKLNFWLVALPALPISLFLSVWATGFFGGFGYILIYQFFNTQLNSTYFLIFFIGLFIVINFSFLFFAFKTAKKTEYKFYSDRIEYFEGFMTIERRTLYYNRIVNISSSQGILEKKYGLGTIAVETPGLGRGNLMISYIENPDKLYNWLTSKIKVGKNNS